MTEENTQLQTPSDDLIEAVARAIYEQSPICRMGNPGNGNLTWEDCRIQDRYILQAKAAIQTIRARDMDKGK